MDGVESSGKDIWCSGSDVKFRKEKYSNKISHLALLYSWQRVRSINKIPSLDSVILIQQWLLRYKSISEAPSWDIKMDPRNCNCYKHICFRVWYLQQIHKNWRLSARRGLREVLKDPCCTFNPLAYCDRVLQFFLYYDGPFCHHVYYSFVRAILPTELIESASGYWNTQERSAIFSHCLLDHIRNLEEKI